MTVNLSALAGAGQQFFTDNGSPLTGGKLYSYVAGTTTPQATYTSASGSTAHSNPIILNAAGRVATGEIWLTAGDNYKFVLKTSTDTTIATWDNITGINGTGITTNASSVQYDPSGTGAVATTVQTKLRESVSVLDFGAKGDGTTNDTTAINNAIATQKAVYFPKGTYLCNVTINNRTILYGDGSTASIITPYSNSAPAMLYTYTAMSNPSPLSFWNYHSVVREIGFAGTSTTSGGSIGFSFGTASPSTYTANAEYANNVQFHNCRFSSNYIGVQFPHGNIGTAFYSCGFQGNYYGAYLLDNRTGFGGGIMHAGNKYFYDGEMSGNACAVYISNQTDGFGAVEFDNVIFELNSLVVYLNDSVNVTFCPVTFNKCWNEANGTSRPGGPATVTIDSWSGSTLTTQTISAAYSFYISGQNVSFNNMFAAGINLFSTNSRAYVNNCRAESNASYGGLPFTVVDDSSRIYFNNCYSSSGFSSTTQCISNGINYPGIASVIIPGGPVLGRSYIAPLGYAVTTGATKTGTGLTFFSAAVYAGTGSGTGTVVTDGIKYTSCNEFTFNFTASTQYIWPTGTGVTTTAASWYAFTVDVKVTVGAPIFSVGDLSANQMSQTNAITADSKWHCFSGVGYFPNVATVYLNAGGAITNATWQYSAFQMWKFSSQAEAVEFLASRTYLG
jgi:hypothetical protein